MTQIIKAGFTRSGLYDTISFTIMLKSKRWFTLDNLPTTAFERSHVQLNYGVNGPKIIINELLK